MGEYSDNLAEQTAYDIGKRCGKAAAGWVFDGNTDRDTYQVVLNGIEDGDPVVLDAYAGYYGMFNEDYGADDLFNDVQAATGDPGPNEDWEDAVITAWELGSSDGFWHEVERVTRYQLEGDEDE